MDKRLAKRHKRQVERAKAHMKLSEPDLRTQEQIEAAREASRPDLSRHANANVRASGPSHRNPAATATGSAQKTSV